MNESFELLSSMSPKIDKKQTPVRRAPTKLALKKYFRRSIDVAHVNKSMKHNSVIIIDSSSTSSSSEEIRKLNDTPIVISDSEDSFKDKTPVKKTSEKAFNTPSQDYRTPDKKTPKKVFNTPGQNYKTLSDEKLNNIELWIENVNKAKQNVSLFSELSTILLEEEDGLKKPGSNTAISSTFLLKSDVKRFDEFFKKKGSSESENSGGKNNLFVNDSLVSDDESFENDFKNMTLDDSLQIINKCPKIKMTGENESLLSEDLQNDFNNLTLDDSLLLDQNESLTSRVKKRVENETKDKNFPSEENNKSLSEKQKERLTNDCDSKSLSDYVEYENLLDSLYGNSWRERKDDILPSSEPRSNKTKPKVKKNVPNTERPAIKIGNLVYEQKEPNLLKDLQRARFRQALETPWKKVLENICDPDTESDDENKMPHVKLNFDEDEPLDSEKIVPTSKTEKKTYLLKEKNHNITTYSFLASLSGNIPRGKSDMTALIFRDNFKQHRDKLTKKLFDLFNEKIFENSIPEKTQIEWSGRLRGTAGYCRCKKITRRTGAIERAVTIVLSTKVLVTADRLRDTLVHEMCHAATWIVNQVSDGHGRFWKSWAYRAMNTFPELPPIKRCHDYVIDTKYTYKCTKCGYCIGRHTKSIDIERKRCGYCYGTFEVLINKTSKKGETKSVPVTPKKVTGFALFVKENYATYKTPDLKHADVMKILGQKFSNLKVDQP